jgi:hypothetical protein
MIKRLERLENTVNKYMADLRPTSQNGSWSEVDDPVYFFTKELIYVTCSTRTNAHCGQYLCDWNSSAVLTYRDV